jgi:7-cyano-7-deazaguanine synthase
MANLATKSAIEGKKIRIETPLIDLSKAEIVKQGDQLGVDYGLTVSCYQADSEGRACGVCDSCRYRKQGFKEAGLADPTSYCT